MPDDTLEERVAAVERAVRDGEDDTAPAEDRTALRDRVATLEEDVDELSAAVQAVRGYVGGVRHVNQEVEQRADAAMAKARTLEHSLAGDGAGVPADGTATPGDGTATPGDGTAAPGDGGEVPTDARAVDGRDRGDDDRSGGPCPRCGGARAGGDATDAAVSVADAGRAPTGDRPSTAPDDRESRPDAEAPPGRRRVAEHAGDERRVGRRTIDERQGAGDDCGDGGADGTGATAGGGLLARLREVL